MKFFKAAKKSACHGGMEQDTKCGFRFWPKLGYEITDYYADSEIYMKELTIALLLPDWCELTKQSFYRELIQYLENLKTQGNKNTLDGRSN